MKRKQIIFVTMVLTAAAVTVSLSACGNQNAKEASAAEVIAAEPENAAEEAAMTEEIESEETEEEETETTEAESEEVVESEEAAESEEIVESKTEAIKSETSAQASESSAPVQTSAPVQSAQPTAEPTVESSVPAATPTPEPAAAPTPEPVATPTPEPVATPTPEPVHEHSWKEHVVTEQVWIPNIVVIDDYEQQSTAYDLYICDCDFETTDPNVISDHIREHAYAGDIKGFTIQTHYHTEQVKVGSHEEDVGGYGTHTYVDYYYCECGATK